MKEHVGEKGRDRVSRSSHVLIYDLHLTYLSSSHPLLIRLGPLEVQHKQRKVGQRKKFERPEPEAQAQRVSSSPRSIFLSSKKDAYNHRHLCLIFHFLS